jgi:hypothetical protein
MSSSRHGPYARWGVVLRSGAYESVVSLDRRSTTNHPDVVFLPADVSEALWSLAVWPRMNTEQGTSFDIAEEEDVDPEQGRRLADLLLEAAGQMAPDAAAITRKAAKLVQDIGASGEHVIVSL